MSTRAAAQEFTGAHGNRLVADVFGADGAPVLLLHGGGQTRHAWRRTAERLAAAGWTAYALDQRGHGDAEWIADGAYDFSDFAGDVSAVAGLVTERHGEKPVAIGASLGGIAALLAQGEAQARGEAGPLGGLVLVDITPRIDPNGVDRVHTFMRAHAHEGFASVADAADVVAAYLPHRPRPRSQEGLRKNLRLRADGRWYWHWDPRFLDGPRTVADGHRTRLETDLTEAAQGLVISTLLVRGGASELVGEEHARAFLALVPHAAYADVAGAHHMVAGDRNDHFSSAILDFLRSHATGLGRRLPRADDTASGPLRPSANCANKTAS
jgi:pimeloyl-ACP methyl ester carboxylesterase